MKFELAWIVVKDLKKAVNFYEKTVGLKVKELNEEWGWAELQGEGGALLGIAQESPNMPDLKGGSNAIVALTVDSLEAAKEKMSGVKMLGEVQEVPGQVRLQLFADNDGNLLQLVEMIQSK